MSPIRPMLAGGQLGQCWLEASSADAAASTHELGSQEGKNVMEGILVYTEAEEFFFNRLESYNL